MTTGPDPRAVRVTLGPTAPFDAGAAIVVGPGAEPGLVDLDGSEVEATLEARDAARSRLTVPSEDVTGEPVVVLPPGPRGHEVLVGGWRIELTVESAYRAALRERATRSRGAAAHHGPSEVRAIIPGRVLSVAVAPGDAVVMGQQLLILEAMKMQNEVRAPRDGTVVRVAVAPGQTLEVGDVLVVVE